MLEQFEDLPQKSDAPYFDEKLNKKVIHTNWCYYLCVFIQSYDPLTVEIHCVSLILLLQLLQLMDVIFSEVLGHISFLKSLIVKNVVNYLNNFKKANGKIVSFL